MRNERRRRLTLTGAGVQELHVALSEAAERTPPHVMREWDALWQKTVGPVSSWRTSKGPRGISVLLEPTEYGRARLALRAHRARTKEAKAVER